MNLERIEGILQLLQRQNYVGEIAVRGEGFRLQARKSPGMPQPPAPEVEPESAPEEAPQHISIVAERVGVYRAPKTPLRSGEHVARGANIGSIDSMRILNPITAGEGGYLLEARVEDGDPVEYGQALFILSPEPAAEESREP